MSFLLIWYFRIPTPTQIAYIYIYICMYVYNKVHSTTNGTNTYSIGTRFIFHCINFLPPRQPRSIIRKVKDQIHIIMLLYKQFSFYLYMLSPRLPFGGSPLVRLESLCKLEVILGDRLRE